MATAEVVVPGEVLGVIEEFLPGNNVYIDEGGRLRALVLGTVIRDLRDHVIHVKRLRATSMPLAVNTVVYGPVVHMPSDKVAVVKILAIENGGAKVMLKNRATGIIPITQVGEYRAASISDLLGIGDVVKARVVSRGPPYTLSIRGYELGVVHGLCPRCRSVMKRRYSDALQCPNCGALVKRKVCLVEYWNP